MCEIDLSVLKRHRGASANVAGRDCYLIRTGYTGEDGFELFSLANNGALQIWNRLIEGGAKPAGLGARDVLRLEAGLPLYGHELSDTISPIQARLDFAVRMDKAGFVGKQALLMIASEPPRRKLAGLKMVSRGIPRQGYAILHKGVDVGAVTSGTFSPTPEQADCHGLRRKQPPARDEVQVRIGVQTTMRPSLGCHSMTRESLGSGGKLPNPKHYRGESGSWRTAIPMNVGINLSQITGEKFMDLEKGMVNIQVTTNINIQKMVQSEGMLDFNFIFTVNYNPAIASLHIKGTAKVSGDEKELAEIKKAFDEKKNLPP